jgi:hypothetical protein
MQLKLLDTGFVSNETRATQTQLSDANRAGYTGSAVSGFSLDVSKVTVSRNNNVEQKPIINSMTDNSSSLVSVGPMTLSVTMRWTKDVVTSGWSTGKLHQFMRMETTYGLKLLYPSAVDDVLTPVVEALAQENLAGNFSDASPSDDNGTIAATLPYLLGRVRNISITDSSKNNKHWTITFDFQVSG